MQSLKRWGFVGLLVLLGIEILTLAPKKLGPGQDEAAISKSVQEAEILPQTKPSQSPHSTVTTMSQVMRGVHLVETGQGRKEWELDSDYAQGFKDKGIWKLKGVHVKFFGSSETTYTVTGDSGSIETETKNMEIEGNVVTTTTDGYLFKSKSLHYTSNPRTLVSDDDVFIVGPKEIDGQFEVSGKGLNAELDSNIMSLKKNVHAVKSISPGKTMTIRSNWARVNSKNSEAHFEDDVQVDIENMRMTGSKADFEYEQKTHLLRSLNMVGNVKVTDQNHWASSKRAQVLFASNEFILTGEPRVIQDDNELRGTEIRFINGGKEVRVSKARARVDNNEVEERKNKKAVDQ